MEHSKNKSYLRFIDPSVILFSEEREERGEVHVKGLQDAKCEEKCNQGLPLLLLAHSVTRIVAFRIGHCICLLEKGVWLLRISLHLLVVSHIEIFINIIELDESSVFNIILD